MARGINKVILVGNLGKDPEVRYMPSGGAVANLTIATSETWKDKATGQNQERTEWHRVVMFNRLGEIAGEYLRKGSKVYIEGKLQTRKWQDQNGNDRFTTEIVANEMQMLDARAGAGADMGGSQPSFGGGAAPQQKSRPQQQASSTSQGYNQYGDNSAPAAVDFGDFDDDIPF